MHRVLIIIALVLLPLFASAQPSHGVSVYAIGGKSITTWHGQAGLTALNIEITRFLSPRTDVAFVLSPMNVHQPRSWFGNQFGDGDEDVHALAGSLLVRRYFGIRQEHVHFYAEGSTGPMWSERKVPASTSRFNFTTQLGAGVVLMPHRAVPVMIGYRFVHISNGGYAPRNPGLNVSSVVIGTRVRVRR
jgi:lipid A 3-O-deacylase PagL